MSLNTLELRWSEDSRLQVLIDGRLLTDRVRQFELSQGYYPFKDDFLLPEDVDWYSRNSWLRSASGEPARLILLGCTCGDVDCSYLYADTLTQNGWILWRFGGWHEWDYKALGSFWFEQSLYQQQVERVL